MYLHTQLQSPIYDYSADSILVSFIIKKIVNLCGESSVLDLSFPRFNLNGPLTLMFSGRPTRNGVTINFIKAPFVPYILSLECSLK